MTICRHFYQIKKNLSWKNNTYDQRRNLKVYLLVFCLKYLTHFVTTIVCRHLAISLEVSLCSVELGRRAFKQKTSVLSSSFLPSLNGEKTKRTVLNLCIVHLLAFQPTVFSTVALMPQCCGCLSSVFTECIVAKWCVLQQQLILTAYGKSCARNRLVLVYRTRTLFQKGTYRPTVAPWP